MNKLLVICGPTSTGKTTLAIELAKKFNGELISADSRQVYKGMDIGTGKDLPKDTKIKLPWFQKYGYYEINGVKVWGYDLADPRHEFNVGQYIKFAERIITDILKRGKSPILVGGTGLYMKGVIDGIPTASIPKNNLLRKTLERSTPEELFEKLAQMDSLKAGQMNASDKRNPRRLIRAIEVAMWKINNIKKEKEMEAKKKDLEVLMIGLTAPEKFISRRVEKRVAQRVKAGIKKEVQILLKKHVTWKMPSMSSMGYREWKDYFDNKKTEAEVVKVWEGEEKKYVKRQMGWFKKDKRIHWFDITASGYPENVEKSVEKWYSTRAKDQNVEKS
ncbi:MAG: tRNA (adenosine(37)-N6)-dimethylallyltransferase MiaA [Candidatus Woesebacteria bacterium]|nr:tRNA (adenosine(37)-N6)-dimethylallyltransferase MiaA [Candidatus Woesebacteria bacterium]